eukprot:1019660-Prymnesium_polylepis.1
MTFAYGQLNIYANPKPVRAERGGHGQGLAVATPQPSGVGSPRVHRSDRDTIPRRAVAATGWRRRCASPVFAPGSADALARQRHL